jgi:hypothetical protein
MLKIGFFTDGYLISDFSHEYLTSLNGDDCKININYLHLRY